MVHLPSGNRTLNWHLEISYTVLLKYPLSQLIHKCLSVCTYLLAITLVVVKSVLAMMDSLGTSVREERDVITGCHTLSLVG